MRIPLTKYGTPQVIIFPLITIAVMAAAILLPLPKTALFTIETLLFIVLIWILSFFRDPLRIAPGDANLLLSPADGTISDIEIVDGNEHFSGKQLKIGIFLSVFNVHINRSPCNATIENIIYKPGKFKDARNPDASKVNEANDIIMIRTDNPTDKLLVRQISGAIARRIVCDVKPGQNLAGGQKFGMIKFGSRTELYMPQHDTIKCLVKKGDKVKAAITPLIRYQK
ncbi:MAG: phosphatidylserine decarboxylase family protein [Planctomycetes bacterium]|nr:phosphatidylserine decarboxylase family protein [Planctomycetota bacterium]